MALAEAGPGVDSNGFGETMQQDPVVRAEVVADGDAIVARQPVQQGRLADSPGAGDDDTSSGTTTTSMPAPLATWSRPSPDPTTSVLR